MFISGFVPPDNHVTDTVLCEHGRRNHDRQCREEQASSL